MVARTLASPCSLGAVGIRLIGCDNSTMLAFLLGILSAALRLSASLRLSDAERGRAIERLKVHYAEGLLSVEELEARVEGVLRSGSGGGIATHFRDLPLRGARQLIVGAVRRFQPT